jgi:hypothetical protein
VDQSVQSREKFPLKKVLLRAYIMRSRNTARAAGFFLVAMPLHRCGTGFHRRIQPRHCAVQAQRPRNSGVRSGAGACGKLCGNFLPESSI